MIALGIPLLTADYDVWLHIDDIEPLNLLCEPLGLFPSETPDAARRRGRYVTKRLAARPKDAEDIRLLSELRSRRTP